MLLFLTREAFLRFSIEERFAGGGDGNASTGFCTSRTGELTSLPCQKARGEFPNGEEPCGEAAAFSGLCQHVSSVQSAATMRMYTFACGKLGEFLRMAMGLSSDSGRFVTIGSLFGEPLLPF